MLSLFFFLFFFWEFLIHLASSTVVSLDAHFALKCLFLLFIRIFRQIDYFGCTCDEFEGFSCILDSLSNERLENFVFF